MDTANDNRKHRDDVSYQFELQATRLQFRITERKRNYTYLLWDERYSKEVTAMVVEEAFDFYRLRLNKGKHRVDVLICQKFNAVLPIRCIAMEESREYHPGSVPKFVRQDRQRRNADEVNVFVSQLLLGHKQAKKELDEMPPRSQRRYLAMRDTLLRPKIGRPLSS